MDLHRTEQLTIGQTMLTLTKWYVHRLDELAANSHRPLTQMTAFLGDFTDAVSRSLALDNKVLSAAATISSEYGDILSLVTRQIFASMDITIPSAQSGQFNSSDVKIFMKDIGQSQ